jgi:iron complex transport system substrate-binding protein
VVLAAVVLLLAGCARHDEAGDNASAPAKGFPVTLSAPGGRPVTVTKQPQRIVSLDPTTTEDLYAVGAGEQVAAVDNQSDYPANAPRTELTGLKPNVEAITGYRPDLVITSGDVDGLVANLAKLKIPVLVVGAPKSLDDAYAEISLLGKATGHPDSARDVVDRMRGRIDQLVRETPKPAKRLSYYHELDQTLYTATSKTFIGSVYSLFGLRNIADSADTAGTAGYPQLSAERVVKANPDIVFLADGKCCGQDEHTVAARHGWSGITAVREANVVTLDDDIASRWGPRLVDLVGKVSQAVTAAGRSK